MPYPSPYLASSRSPMPTALPRPRRYTPPPADLFVRNRRKFVAQLRARSAAVLFGADSIPSNSDAHYPFLQNKNYYYLTGLDQSGGILWLCPDAPKLSQREVLFIPRTSPQIQLWDGWKYSPEEAAAASGVSTIRYLDEFEAFYRHLLSHVDSYYLDFIEHDRASGFAPTPAHDFARRLRTEHPAHRIRRANPILAHLRLHKEPEEVAQVREAIRITAAAFERVRAFLRPGVKEYEVEAEITHEFLRHGSSGHAYTPIVASGPRACVLHYIQNNQACEAGHVLLLDVGAEYGNYAADMTRCLPVSGRFTERQLEVYEAVRRVKDVVTAAFRPGLPMQDLFTLAGEAMTRELIALRLITEADVAAQTDEAPAYKKYFPHGIGHPLGLDVHDLGNRYGTLAPGVLMTVEPGIYIPDEGIGIRLENNVLVTTDGYEDLMAAIPIRPEQLATA